MRSLAAGLVVLSLASTPRADEHDPDAMAMMKAMEPTEHWMTMLHGYAFLTATAGYVREIPLLTEAETGVGGAVTVYRFDSVLDSVYGDRPISLEGYLRMRFGRHLGRHGAGEHMHH